MADLTGVGKTELLKKILGHVCKQYKIPEDQVVPMLPNFVTVLKGHTESLEAALVANDIEDIGRRGHALKGVLLNLGLFEIAALAEIVESAAKNGDRDVDYWELLERIKRMLKSILK